MRLGHAVTAVAAAGLLTAGCGGGSTSDAVADAGTSLGRIHSGSLHMKLELGSGAADPSSRVGFEMNGPFDLAPAGATLPVADLTSTNLSDPATPTVRFVSTGHAAFIVKSDVGYQLTDQQLSSMRLDAVEGAGSGGGGFRGLDLHQWVVDPVQQPSNTVGGENVDTITGRVDPVAALNGIVVLAGQLGNGQDTSLRVDDAEADRVRSAAQSSTFEVVTGHDDHLLRSLTARVEFSAPAAPGGPSGIVLQTLQKVGRLTLTIELRIDRPNSSVSVPAPSVTRPMAAYGG